MIIGPDTTKRSESYSEMTNTTSWKSNFDDAMLIDFNQANGTMFIDLSHDRYAISFDSYHIASVDSVTAVPNLRPDISNLNR